MADKRELRLAEVEKLPTDIYGLMWLPTLGESRDSIGTVWNAGLHDPFSDCCKAEVKSSIEELGSSLKCIVEIGVDRDRDGNTITKHILQHKLNDTIYLGVDVNDKSRLNDPNRNVHTICVDSKDRQAVMDKLTELGIESIDLLFIDGDHSINGVVNDWQYVERVSLHGIVLMHDIEGNPGPMCVFDAIDPELFEKQMLCMEGDYGLGKLRRQIS